MTLIKWNPTLRPTLFNEIDSWFNNMTSDLPLVLNEPSEWKPGFEVLNGDNAYRLRADLPGLNKKDINIEIKEDILTISGERKNKTGNNDDHYSEFSYGKFSKSFNLPDDVKQNSIKAAMKDGVLALEIPRIEKVKPEVKTITIK